MSGGTLYGAATWAATALLAMVLAGCAAGPSVVQPGRIEDDKSDSSSHEHVEVDSGVRADFETAMEHMRAGAYEKGAELLRKVAQRAPGYPAPHVNLAIAYQKLGKLPAAEESAKQALAADPDHAAANTEYGLILRKTGRFEEARRAYERALARDPGFLPARKNLGILCDVYLRDLDCALEHYRLYSSAVPDDKTVQLWIADLEQRRGKEKQ